MIINKDSCLYNLPAGLALKDLLILDSIRFTIELIEHNYLSLYKELETISFNFENENYTRNLIPVFNNCWSLIDNCQRLINQYKLLPSDNDHQLIKEISYITPLRNTFQHMDERINECLFEAEMPFYGVVSWEVKLTEGEMTQKFFLISSLYIPRGKLMHRVKKKENPKNILVDISLETFIRKGRKPNVKFEKIDVNITRLFNQIISLIKQFESKLDEVFMNQNATKTDWSKRRDIMLKINY
ncbi:hypothetical protein D1614_23540 [Maribellus luteus]|uniref:Uncharacterized protein n=1 Tax=Maribellus luteus TaxID=2305463 RepID=A0A399SQX2_9BACT|nr:hypothetical protein [Maribellus luteus]RIJ45289.1 hypothetical protein D1614_23540 [Maribellus luteus]